MIYRSFLTSVFFIIVMLLAQSGGFTQTRRPNIGMVAKSAALMESATSCPQHPVITGITWDFAHQIILASGSDLWPTTWGADDHVWTGWGDGGGFGGGNHINRASVGFARISGIPPNIKGSNIWGSTKTGGGKAQYQATFCGKPESEISAKGVLYVWIGSYYNNNVTDTPHCAVNPSVPNHHLAYSTDGGITWKEKSWEFTENMGAFVFNNFINFGRDNAEAPEGYVYLYGRKIGDSTDTYLARVAPDKVISLPDYEVFTGLDEQGDAKWSDTFQTSNAKPVDPANGGIGATFYHAVTGSYVTANFRTGIGSLVINVAPQPWGPWTTIESEDDWGGFGNTGEPLLLTFPTKWISTDGKTLWGVFSWGSPAGDAFHLLKATLSFGNASTLPNAAGR